MATWTSLTPEYRLTTLMNLSLVLLTLFLSAVRAKISITSPENNETAKAAFETLFSKVNCDKIRKCGDLLKTESQASFRSCIKALRTPKIFEKHLWDLENDDFAANYGIAFSGTMSDIIAKVSDEVEKSCSHVDPNTFDQVTYDKIIQENRQPSATNTYTNNDDNRTNYNSFSLDWLHFMLIIIIVVLFFGGALYYLNDRRSVQINRKLVNDLSEKI